MPALLITDTHDCEDAAVVDHSETSDLLLNQWFPQASAEARARVHELQRALDAAPDSLLLSEQPGGALEHVCALLSVRITVHRPPVGTRRRLMELLRRSRES